MDPLQSTLVQYFKLQQFRRGQREIISDILNRNDVLAVLPTGGGKSLCFQLPALVKQSLVIVVSPLIALMKDQVQSLQKKGIPAGCLYAGQSLDEKRMIFRDMQKGGPYLLYLSPERVQKQGFQDWVMKRPIALFAIDEAHCVSQWGHDFRGEYAALSILRKLRPDVPVLALTASATPQVLFDVARQLKLKDPKKRVHGFYRPNLYYQVEVCEDDDDKQTMLLSAISQFPHGRIIVYCGTRKTTEELARTLSQKFAQVGFYHAGLSTEQRTEIQERYTAGDIRILTATNAFGMGIDQPDVRLVVHYQLPANIDSLYQEMGRAGRDEMPSTCLLLYAKADKGLQSFFIKSSEAPREIQELRWRNLDALVSYAEGGECRHSEILAYYKDDQRINSCGHCDTCLPQSDRRVRPVKRVMSLAAAKSLGKKVIRRRAAVAPVDLPLDEDQTQLLKKLKAWRLEQARAHDQPAFIICSDRSLIDLIHKRPQSLEELRQVYGFGEAKVDEYGWDILAELES